METAQSIQPASLLPVRASVWRSSVAGTLAVAALLSFGRPGHGQVQPVNQGPSAATGGAAARPMLNSLGVPFVEVPGTPVLFAAWETRVADFARFVRESGYPWDYKTDFPQSPNHPVVNVTLRDAIAYCNWLTQREQDSGAISAQQSYRLPTRKEWDAAVGLAAGRSANPSTVELERDKQRFPWGLEWPPPLEGGNLNSFEITGKDDGYAFTAPVGRYAPNDEGIYDLAGNVWEWTWDRDNQSETAGVLRGGSWMYFRKECLLSGYQYEVPSTLRSPGVGFRCVFDDRRRTAAFLAMAGKSGDAKQAAGSGTVTAASPDEVRRMREEMDSKKLAAAKSAAVPGLPDASTLAPAKRGEPYTNMLGMRLLPLNGAPSLLVGANEVRIQDYEAALKEQGRTWDRKPALALTAVHPIINVTWKEAVQFCEWLTEKERKAGLIGPGDRYRLPTDMEWSLAAGLAEEEGGTPESRHLGNRVDYPWGKGDVPPGRSANLDSARMTNGYVDSFSHTAPVGSFPANAQGFHDLAGNVAEWCEDAWPSATGERVARGSSWLTSATESMLSSARQHLPETSARPDTGFRVVLEFAP